MSDKVFNKIIEQIRKIKPVHISPFLHGEMFLDKNILNRLKLIDETLPESKLIIITNDSLLTEGIIDYLLTLNLCFVIFSLNAVDEISYNKIVGLKNYSKTVANINYFIRENNNRNVWVSLVNYSDYTKKILKDFVGKWGHFALVEPFKNYAGLMFDLPKAQKSSCAHPFKSICFLYNGDVSLCCMDMEGKIIFGNIMEDDLSDIWNSPKMLKYRYYNLINRRDLLTPCKNCTMT